MVSELATRFAEVSLKLYGHEQSFDIGLDNDQELEAVAQAFESLGCQVERNELRHSLTVICPQGK
ncbi:hypothetical protein EON81_05350 [bacterium]|nr:MAG: hypothetical protein EON81_05350 [bacterium]